MKTLMLAALLAAQDAPAMPKPAPEHEWLKQLVGEWTTEGECVAGPDQPPIKMKGTESVTAVGGFWVRAANQGEIMGMPFEGHLTLGYDAAKKHYVGSWIDNMSGHLWTYRGSVDGRKLTLDAEGPSMLDPTKPAKYRETLEIKSADHKVFTSSIEKDGAWTLFMTIHYHRKK
jgi:hypothetical protein